MRDIQLRRYCGDSNVLAFVGKRRRTGDHSKFRDFGEQIQQFLGEAIGEVFVAGVIAHVDERQHRNRLLRWPTNPPFVVRKQNDRGSQQRNDDEVQPSTGDVRYRFCPVNVFLEIDTLWRNLVEPGENQCDRKPYCEEQENGYTHPIRQLGKVN